MDGSHQRLNLVGLGLADVEDGALELAIDGAEQGDPVDGEDLGLGAEDRPSTLRMASADPPRAVARES